MTPKLFAHWNRFPVYSFLGAHEQLLTQLICDKLHLDDLKRLKAELMAEQGYYVTIRRHCGDYLPMDLAFCEIVEKDIRLFIPEPFGSGFVIFASGTEIEVSEEELGYILNASFILAMDSIWQGLGREVYLKYLKETSGLS